MDDLVRLRLIRNAGVVTSAELMRLGLDGDAVRRLVRGGGLVRVRCGAFVDGPTWRNADPQARHHLAARAMLSGLDGYAWSHLTALVLHALPVLASDLEHVHVVQIGQGRARRAGHLRVHPAVSPDQVVRRHGVGFVGPGLALMQASGISLRAGLVGADAALRAGLTTGADLVAIAERRGTQAARQVAALASPLSESPGESWTRLVWPGSASTPTNRWRSSTPMGGSWREWTSSCGRSGWSSSSTGR